MNWQPLFAAAPPIPLHAFAAFGAIGIGAVQFAAPKGTLLHRALGFFWAALMLLVAGSSLWIHELRQWRPWSWIHLLSLLTLVAVPAAIWHAHRHRVRAHGRMMVLLYLLALVVTGLFTLLPGRIMHDVFLGLSFPRGACPNEVREMKISAARFQTAHQRA